MVLTEGRPDQSVSRLIRISLNSVSRSFAKTRLCRPGKEETKIKMTQRRELSLVRGNL